MPELGSNKHVFIDWSIVEPGYGLTSGPEYGGPDKPTSWEMPVGIHLKVHAPRIDPRPLIWCDRPWESVIVTYSTLLQDEGRYRLYYECKYKSRLDSRLSDSGSMVAYAESSDFESWTKPVIGVVPFDGSTDNNLVFARGLTLGRDVHGATVFKDPIAPADQRYKMVHMGWDYKSTWDVCGAVSPDGLHWKAVEKPLIQDYTSDTQNVMAFDPVKGKYVGYFRGWTSDSLKRRNRRMIAYAESDTFESFPRPQQVVAADANDTPDVDVYTNSYTRWPGTMNAHLMFAALYAHSTDLADVHLLTSRDGAHWQRPLRQAVIGSDEHKSGWEGGIYAGCGVVETPSGEWALPLGPSRTTHNQPQFPGGRTPENPLDRGYLCLALWRKDGFMSLEAPTEGKWSSITLSFEGRQLKVNAWTQYGGEILVELAQASGEPLPNFTFEDCDPISGDVPDHVVTWRGQSDISSLAGQDLRMRWRMRRARLYSLQFV